MDRVGACHAPPQDRHRSAPYSPLRSASLRTDLRRIASHRSTRYRHTQIEITRHTFDAVTLKSSLMPGRGLSQQKNLCRKGAVETKPAAVAIGKTRRGENGPRPNGIQSAQMCPRTKFSRQWRTHGRWSLGLARSGGRRTSGSRNPHISTNRVCVA